MSLSILILSCDSDDSNGGPDLVTPTTLPDLSGLSWVQDDLFIGVHDAKNTAEKLNWPRVSLIRLPESELEGVIWEPVPLDFPGPGGPSSDLESSCSIPGGNGFLFVESGQEGADYRRIFFANYNSGTLFISTYAEWPTDVTNVEATEVCQVGGRLVFLYAERAQDQPSTLIRWADLSLSPIAFGDFKEVTYQAIDPVGPGTRPIVALEVDSDGFIYIVSAYDSGSDDGPYRSVVWMIGQIISNGADNPEVVLGEGVRLGTLDGLKIESIAVRELEDGKKEVYIGSDDEHYGGIMRLLPPPVLP
jgi:hypothetical protein